MPTSEESTDTSVVLSRVSGPGIVSVELVEIFHTVNNAILSSAIATMGIVTNLINLMVFWRQGITDTVNMSLLALTISDLCSLLTLQWIDLLWNPLFFNSGVPLVPEEVQHLTGGWPHVCFAKITSWITVFITLERCLCVTIPLKVKRIITPRRTFFVLISIYIFMFLTLVPEYATAYIDWKFYPDTNRTMLGLIFTENRESLADLSFVLSAVTQNVSFLAVIVFTVILVMKMREKSKWRQGTAANVGQESSSSKRDSKTVKMITLIAVIYIVCFLPSVVNYTVSSIVPEFGVVGRYQNAFFASWSFAFLVESVNSSVNIFVYYSMSTKYRNTLDGMFALRKRDRNISPPGKP